MGAKKKKKNTTTSGLGSEIPLCPSDRGLRLLCSALLGSRRLQLYLPLVRAEVQPGSQPSAPLPQLGIEFGSGTGHTSPQGSSRGSVSTSSGPPRSSGYEGPVTLTGKAASRHWLAVGWGEGPPGSQDAPLPSWGLDLAPDPLGLPLIWVHVWMCPSGSLWPGAQPQGARFSDWKTDSFRRCGGCDREPWGDSWPWSAGGDTERKHSHIVLSILTLTSWISQRAPSMSAWTLRSGPTPC